MEGGEGRGGTGTSPPHRSRGPSLARRDPGRASSRLRLGSSLPLGALDARISRKDQPGAEGFWRPWIASPEEAEGQKGHPRALCSASETTEDSAKLTQYTHPVRLFWPKSRCFDYLYHEAEALLRNFPVQATISFYEDSESEEDNDELDHDSEAELDC